MAETDERLDNDTERDADGGASRAGHDGSQADELESLRAESDELRDKYQRALAETQNVRRRSIANEEEARRQGARRILESIVPVLDHFDLALGQDPEKTTAAQIIGGVSVIRDEFRKALAAAGVSEIEARPGGEFDPTRHEAVLRQPSDDVPEGAIVMLLQGGYAMGERVIRPAKVAVSSGPAPAGDAAQA